MIIAVIILAILLLISCMLNFKLARTVLELMKTIVNQHKEFEEIQFMEGFADISEEDILVKFEDVSLVCQTLPSDTGEMSQVFDTSLYLKNKIIGLTYFVPRQVLENVSAELAEDKNAIIRQIKRKLRMEGAEEEANDEEMLQKIVDDAIQQADIASATPILQHCTVLHLKDGRWIWRQEDG